MGSAIRDIVGRPASNEVSQIDVISLSDAKKKFEIEKIDFIKMDIEGAEVEVINGSKEFIKNENIDFAIVNHHIVKNGLKKTGKFLRKSSQK